MVEQLDEEKPWDQTLSGGEKQRVAFARLLVQKPDIIVMDEGTSALDPKSQEDLMKLIQERLPKTTILSVGHRPELEKFHERKLVLEAREEGAKLARDIELASDGGSGGGAGGGAVARVGQGQGRVTRWRRHPRQNRLAYRLLVVAGDQASRTGFDGNLWEANMAWS